MQLTKQSLLTIVFSLMLIGSQILVQIRQQPSDTVKPDLQTILKQHPDGWQPISGSTVNPSTQNSAYDLVASQIYKSSDGKVVSVLMTWSYDGFHRAGHPQEGCYDAQGLAVTQALNGSVMVGAQKINFVTFSGRYGSVTEDVIYWRVTGGIHDATLKENISMIKRFKEVPRILIGDIPDNIMVRVSTWRPATDPPSTVHIDYIKSYLQSLKPKTRHILTGL